MPHERADEAELMPLVARALGDPATTTMRRTHAEIEHQVSRLRRLLDGIDPGAVSPEDVTELRRLLYGLYAVCRLHNSQEEEGAFALVPAARPTALPDAAVGTVRPADRRGRAMPALSPAGRRHAGARGHAPGRVRPGVPTPYWSCRAARQHHAERRLA